MTHDFPCRGGGGDDGDVAAMCREHPQDVALDAVIDRCDAVLKPRMEATPAISIPYRFIPLVGLAASHLLGEIHAFETRPRAGPDLEQSNIEPSIGIVRDDGV